MVKTYEEEFANQARELFAEVIKARIAEEQAKVAYKDAKAMREGAEKELDKHLASDARDLPLFGHKGAK